VFKELQNGFSLHGDGLAWVMSLKTHFLHSHQCFLENLDDMRDYKGE